MDVTGTISASGAVSGSGAGTGLGNEGNTFFFSLVAVFSLGARIAGGAVGAADWANGPADAERIEKSRITGGWTGPDGRSKAQAHKTAAACSSKEKHRVLVCRFMHLLRLQTQGCETQAFHRLIEIHEQLKRKTFIGANHKRRAPVHGIQGRTQAVDHHRR